LSLSLADLKGYVNAETGVAPSRQEFYLNGQPVAGDTTTLVQAGVKDGETLYLLINPEEQAANPSRQATTMRPGSQPVLPHNGLPTPAQCEATRRSWLRDPKLLELMRKEDPELAAATNDPPRFREEFQKYFLAREERKREAENWMKLANEDPFNVEAQCKIEEIIRKDRVMENLQHALEHNPEGESDCSAT